MYRTIRVDLTLATPGVGAIAGAAGSIDVQLVEPGKKIVEMFCLDMPVGNQFSLKLGRDNPDYFTVSNRFTMQPTGEKENTNGVFYQNLTPQAGVIIELVVVFGDPLNTVTP